MKLLKVVRRCIQILVCVGLTLLPWAQSLGLNLGGSFFALQLGPIPFADPVAALTVLGTMQMPKTQILLGAGLALIIAVLMGRIFCGWICPYGFLSELIHGSRPSQAAKAPHSFFIKVLLLIFLIGLWIDFALPLINVLSFPGELSLLPILTYTEVSCGVFVGVICVPVIILLLERICGQRLWCKYFCPQSVLLGVAASLLPKKSWGLRIIWTPNKCSCRDKAPCKAACSLDLNPKKLLSTRRDCSQCGDCVQACSKHGQALSYSFQKVQKAQRVQK
ncbi:MAG: 4Fe-4S binding protein [Desulfovibrionaceae bacterium]|nr:4Fe-4S binding protein [Desulfovibrionaceae bacterium]